MAVRRWVACAFANWRRSDMPPFLGCKPATLQRRRAVPGTRHRCKHDRMTFECAISRGRERGVPCSNTQCAPDDSRSCCPDGRLGMSRVAVEGRFDGAVHGGLGLGHLGGLGSLGALERPVRVGHPGREEVEAMVVGACDVQHWDVWVGGSYFAARRKGRWNRWGISGLLKMALATNTG